MRTVLLTNGQQRKTLSAARSLGKKGIRVIVAEVTRLNPSAFSKYCSKALVYPDPGSKPDEFYQWLRNTITKYKCDVVFPMDDDTMDVVMRNYEELSAICSIPVPTFSSYDKARDKGEAAKLVEESGGDCPRTLIPGGSSEVEALADKISFPVVIKPSKGSGSRGIRIVNNKEELLKEYKAIHSQYPYPLLQEYVELGQRVDVCLVYDKNSNLKAHFIQREIRHFPVDIGPSTLQEGICNDELLAACLKTMEKLPWYGVVEFEFMRDGRDGKYKFMEINPRFWASLHTAVISGVDFPNILYDLASGEDVEYNQDYEKGKMCRWLLPGDILHYIANKDRGTMKPSFWNREKFKIEDDIVSSEDPLPVLGFILACLKYSVNIKMWKFIFKR